MYYGAHEDPTPATEVLSQLDDRLLSIDETARTWASARQASTAPSRRNVIRYRPTRALRLAPEELRRYVTPV